MSTQTADEFLARTGKAIEFLRRLEDDKTFAARCARTDLEGRLELARLSGFDFDEQDLRATVRLWDYHGAWNRWLFSGRLDDSLADLPELSAPHRLNDESVAAFRHDGHLLLRGVLDESEVAAFRPVIRGAVARYIADATGVESKLAPFCRS